LVCAVIWVEKSTGVVDQIIDLDDKRHGYPNVCDHRVFDEKQVFCYLTNTLLGKTCVVPPLAMNCSQWIATLRIKRFIALVNASNPDMDRIVTTPRWFEKDRFAKPAQNLRILDECVRKDLWQNT
jgi:hypothetical protein